jgi:3-oxoadipate enol-lactonase
MTTATLTFRGVDIAYEVHGNAGSWVTFSHSLGCDRHLWRRQIDVLAGRCRILSHDLPGHGESGAGPEPGSLGLLAADVRALMDHLAIEKTHFVGISIGGMIGQTLALDSPGRIDRLVLANTTAYMPPPVVQLWAQRIALAREQGLTNIAQASLERWFPPAYRAAHPERIAEMAQVFAATSVAGYVTCSQAIMGLDTRQRLRDIACPVLILGGTEDPGAPIEALRLMQQGITGAELMLLAGAGHLSCVDAADDFTAALIRFLCL